MAALVLFVAIVAVLVALVLAVAFLGRTRREPLGDDLIVRELRPRGNVRRLGGDECCDFYPECEHVLARLDE